MAHGPIREAEELVGEESTFKVDQVNKCPYTAAPGAVMGAAAHSLKLTGDSRRDGPKFRSLAVIHTSLVYLLCFKSKIAT